MRSAGERIANRDVAAAIDGGTRQPPKEAVRCVSALLMEPDGPAAVNPELVPAHATASRRRVHGMDGHDRLLIADSPVNHARHDLVALCVEAAAAAWLRNAVRELAIA